MCVYVRVLVRDVRVVYVCICMFLSALVPVYVHGMCMRHGVCVCICMFVSACHWQWVVCVCICVRTFVFHCASICVYAGVPVSVCCACVCVLLHVGLCACVCVRGCLSYR